MQIHYPGSDNGGKGNVHGVSDVLVQFLTIRRCYEHVEESERACGKLYAHLLRLLEPFWRELRVVTLFIRVRISVRVPHHEDTVDHRALSLLLRSASGGRASYSTAVCRWRYGTEPRCAAHAMGGRGARSELSMYSGL